MITKPLFAAAASVLLLACGFGTAAAVAEELGSREIRRLDRRAEKALEADQSAAAAELYQQLLDATATGDERRRDALWMVAMSRLAADPGDAAGRGYLQELEESFPRHSRKLELATFTAVLVTLDAARSEIDGVQAKLEEQSQAFAAARRKIEEEQEMIAGESEEAGDRVRTLENQLRRTRADLAATKEELEKKEEALQRLLRLRSDRGSG